MFNRSDSLRHRDFEITQKKLYQEKKEESKKRHWPAHFCPVSIQILNINIPIERVLCSESGERRWKKNDFKNLNDMINACFYPEKLCLKKFETNCK